MAAGIAAVGLGTIGVFVPLLPTTPFLLLAAACFMRSSDRLYVWLLSHRWFGSYIRNYREHRAVTRGVRAVALILLWVAIGYSAVVVVTAWWIRTALGVILVGVTLHLLSLKTLTQHTKDSPGAATAGESAASRRGLRGGPPG